MTWRSEAERVAAWRERNPEKFREQLKRYYLKHSREIKQKRKDWAFNNPEKKKVIQKRAIEKLKDKGYYKDYYLKNRDKILQYYREKTQENRSNKLKNLKNTNDTT